MSERFEKRDAQGRRPTGNTARRTDGDKYVTDLDFISNWDEIHYEPSDVYAQGADSLFEQPPFDSGEDYPHGR